MTEKRIHFQNVVNDVFYIKENFARGESYFSHKSDQFKRIMSDINSLILRINKNGDEKYSTG